MTPISEPSPRPPISPESPPSSPRKLRPAHPECRLALLLAAALAFLLPFLLYIPALRFGLLDLDDFSFVASNPAVQGGLCFPAVRDAFLAPLPSAPMYIPLLWISYMLDVSLFGNHPWAFHLTNILFHSTSSLLLFLLLLRFARRFSPFHARAARPSSLVAPCLLLALLWSLHPLRVESVAWVAERKDCLAVFFCLLVLHAWLSALDARRTARRLFHTSAALVLFALGLLSKPSLVPVPLVLPLLALLPGRTRRPRLLPLSLALLPFFLLSALSALATAAFHGIANHIPAPPFFSRLATVPSVFFFSLSKILLPIHLSVIYPKWTSPLWLGALLAVPLVLAAAWIFRLRRTHPLFWFGTLFAVLFFLPVSGIVPIPYTLVADRYTCLPAIGLSIALLGVFPFSLPPAPVGGPPPANRPLPSAASLLPLSLLALLLVACAAATAVCLPVWRDSPSLYLPARRLSPDHFTIRAYDAAIARRHGAFAASRECIARAAALFPDYALVLADAPNVSALDGPEAALRFLLDNPPPPNHAAEWAFHVSAAQLELERNGDALSTALRALSAAPQGDPARGVLLQTAMIASWRLGRVEDALRFARFAGVVPDGATSLSPVHFVFYGISLWNTDLRRPALRFFRDLAADAPPPLLNNVSWILSSSFYSPAPPAESIALARAALDATPSDSPFRPIFLDTLAVALANATDFPAAIEAVSAGISLLPSSSPTLPAMRRRLDLYQRNLPYREHLGVPVPPSEYSFDLRL